MRKKNKEKMRTKKTFLELSEYGNPQLQNMKDEKIKWECKKQKTYKDICGDMLKEKITQTKD